MRRPAWIGFGASPTAISCVIWDQSEGGARLTAAHSNILPDIFMLFLTRDGKSYRYCRVKWRKRPYLGVQFIAASESRVLARFHGELCVIATPGSTGAGVR